MILSHKHRLLNWRAGLFLACLALLAWLWWGVSPAASQEPPGLSVEGSGGLAVPGGEVTYHIRLLNWTDEIIPAGTISHTLPAGFSYVPSSTMVTVGGWPITTTEPISQDGTLAWGAFQLPAAGHSAHNPYGAHTFVQDLCLADFIDFQLDQALALVGSGGYVTQLFYRITPATSGPDPCAVYFVNAAYDRNLVPILRLQGNWNPVGFWEKPDPGPDGDYAEIAAAFARYVEGLPRRNTHPLYVTIWNEPDLWVEWSGAPSAWEYGRFFVAVSNAIRRLGDPRIRILNGATTPSNRTFIRQLMAVPGFVNAFDAWASHCYPYNHPPWYNIHHRTATYGNTVIDCYIEERDTIARYGGRTGFKFVVKETGHGLGDNLYAFEGFPAINESNRASYIASAFHSYWRTWPEVIAVTPFELGDPWSGWEWLDWIDYSLSMDPFSFSYAPHPQYDAVAARSKPRGAPVPHGFEVTFRARLADDLPLGLYLSDLSGSAISTTVVLTQAAPVQVAAHLERYYFPMIWGRQGGGGVWYLGLPPDSSTPDLSLAEAADVLADEGDGAIVPTHFLTSAAPPRSNDANRSYQTDLSLPPSNDVNRHYQPWSLAGQLTFLTRDGGGERAYVGLRDGELAVLSLRGLEVERRIPLGSELVALTPGPEAAMLPEAATLYGALDTGHVVLIQAASGELNARTDDLVRPRGLAFDPATGTLLVADAGQGELVRFSGDLSARLAARPLDDPPDQVLLDAAGRRLYVMSPGARRVLALDADTLRPLAEGDLVGGPLIEMALDAARGRVYVLSALSPRYRGIFVLQADDLSSLALVAESPAAPLRQATALALSPDGQLLVTEGDRLYRISPEDFSLVSQARLEGPVGGGLLAVDPVTGRTVWIGPDGVSATEGLEPETPAPPGGAP